MAPQFPKSRIAAASNSTSVRGYVEGEAMSCGLSNRRVITQGMNVVQPEQTLDRIVSVEKL